MAAAVAGLRASYHRLLDRIELKLPPRFRPFYNHPAGNGASSAGGRAAPRGEGRGGHLGRRSGPRRRRGAGGPAGGCRGCQSAGQRGGPAGGGGGGVGAAEPWLRRGEGCRRAGSCSSKEDLSSLGGRRATGATRAAVAAVCRGARAERSAAAAPRLRRLNAGGGWAACPLLRGP